MSVERFSTCMLCPRLCRTSCPVATGAATETAVPSFIAAVLHRWEQGRASDDDARHVATQCTDCGACQERCHLHRPLPQLLREVRQQLEEPASIAPLQDIDGAHAVTVVHADERPFAEALAAAIGAPVSTWRTSDRLGVAAIEHPRWRTRCADLRAHAQGRELVVIDGGIAQALASAGLSFAWLHERVPGLEAGTGSCVTEGERPLACCGAGGALARHHPNEAARVGRVFGQRMDGGRVQDGRCAAHLRGCGVAVTDSLDALMAQQAALPR